MKRIVPSVFVFLSILLIYYLPAVAICEGDLNCDGVVDGSDLAEFAGDYGYPGCPIKTVKYIICWGLLSTQGRWCDNEDGTVTDMTTGLVWLKNANWVGEKVWMDMDRYDDAQAYTGVLQDGLAGLNDKSVAGEWRLPTKVELVGITQGHEAILSSRPIWFTGVQSGNYWSSTTNHIAIEYAWHVNMESGDVYYTWKRYSNYMWPVRGSR